MQYLIDGHNLIPKLGISLNEMDDEAELMGILQEFCRLKRAGVEVFFDGAPPGQATTRRIGMVTAHFIRKDSSADSAIETRLSQLKKNAANWTLVSSDARLRWAAKSVHARSLTSEEFASLLKSVPNNQQKQEKTDAPLNIGELDEWLQLFKKRGG